MARSADPAGAILIANGDAPMRDELAADGLTQAVAVAVRDDLVPV